MQPTQQSTGTQQRPHDLHEPQGEVGVSIVDGQQSLENCGGGSRPGAEMTRTIDQLL